MRTLVVLALFGSAFASPFLQYTPEVVAERARFQQLFNAQAAAAAAAPDDPVGGARYQQAPASNQWSAPPQATQWSAQPSNQWNAPQTHTAKWTGPVATDIPAGLPGSTAQVADTADVTAARDQFLAAYRAQVAATTGQQIAAPRQSHTPTQQYTPHYQNTIPGAPQKWTGPLAATVPAGVDGRITPVSDTAEVAAARTAFQNAYSAAVSATRSTAGTQTWSAAPKQSWSPAPQQPTWSAVPQQAKWTGPVAATIPAGLPGAGAQVGQTADVAAATAAFHQAYGAAVAATTGRRY